MSYEYHPFSEICPLLEGAAFDKFVADIAANGQRFPILLYQDKILDGRNRDRACTRLGITPKFEQAAVRDDDAALALIVSLNVERRHLTIAQLAFIGEALANLKQGTNRFVDLSRDKSTKLDPSGTGSLAMRQAAKMVGVSQASVSRARQVRTYGNKQLEADVVTGKTSLKAAAESVTPKRTSVQKQESRGAKREKAQQRKEAIARDRENLGKLKPLKVLSATEIDPDLAGVDRVTVARKYGHIPTRTKPQVERDEAIQRADDYLTWLGKVPTVSVSVDDFITWLAAGKKVDGNYRRDKLSQRVEAGIAALAVLSRLRELSETREIV